MVKSIKALSGAAKDAYLKHALAAEPTLARDVRERLTHRLQKEIALISLKQRPRRVARGPHLVCIEDSGDVLGSTGDSNSNATVMETAVAAGAEAAVEPADAQAVASFDPYSPNVIVVIRTRGRDAVLEELHLIEDVDCLRLLAREQQLGIASDLDSATEIRLAIVAAAERRIANRRAAAS